LAADADLARTGVGADSRGDVNSPAPVRLSSARRFGHVHTDAHLWREAVPRPMLGKGSLDLDRALERTVRVLESDEEAVPRVVDRLRLRTSRRAPEALRRAT
jgi:hypothetical protein